MVKIKDRITTLLERGIEFTRKREADKLEHFIMKKLNIPDKPAPGEKDYLEYWSGLLSYPTPSAYRVYSKFCGCDKRIVSETASLIINFVLNPARFVAYASDKNTFDILLPNIKMPHTIIRMMDGMIYDKNYRYLGDLTESLLNSCLAEVNTCVLKPTVESNSGKGVMVFNKIHNEFMDNDRNKLTVDLLSKYGRNWIIQDGVKQNEFMAQFNSTSVNTLRIATYRSVKDNSIHILSGVIRMGSKGSSVDNSHAGGKMVRFDKNGILASYCTNQYAERYQKHNNIDFSNSHIKIPEYNKIVVFAKKIANTLKQFRLLQLDIAIDENNNPILIEFNCSGYSARIAQRTGTSAFGKWSDEIIEYVRANRPQKLYLVKI